MWLKLNWFCEAIIRGAILSGKLPLKSPDSATKILPTPAAFDSSVTAWKIIMIVRIIAYILMLFWIQF